MIDNLEIYKELYKRGNYTIQTETPWGVHLKQDEALKLLNSQEVEFIGYGGSARSGKSWVASEWLTMQCLCYDGVGYGLARKELKNLKRTTLLTLFKVFQKYGLKKDEDYRYNQQDSVIRFYNGSEIFLIDTASAPSDPLNTKLGGYELTGCVIDESNETKYDVVETVRSRCGFRLNDLYNIKATVLETFNPDKGHVYTRYFLPYRENSQKNKIKFIPALPKDNPSPEVKSWIDSMIETATETTIKRLIYGDFDYDESLDKLIEQDAINDYFTNEFVKKTGVRHISSDIARKGKDSTIIKVWDGLVCIERVELRQLYIDETAKAIKDLANQYEVPMSRVVVDEDGVGGGVRDILKCWGFVANRTPKGKTNYQNLKAQCGFKLAEFINKRLMYEPVSSPQLKDKISQELDWLRHRDIDSEGKQNLVSKDLIKQAISRSPDDLDCNLMLMFFYI